MGKEGASKVQAVAMGHNKGMLQKGIDKCLEIDAKIMKLKADRMNVINGLDDQGFDPKEIKEVIKIKTKAKTLAFKRGVNQMCLEIDMPEEYNLTEEQLKKLREQDKEEEGGSAGEHGDEEEAA